MASPISSITANALAARLWYTGNRHGAFPDHPPIFSSLTTLLSQGQGVFVIPTTSTIVALLQPLAVTKVDGTGYEPTLVGGRLTQTQVPLTQAAQVFRQEYRGLQVPRKATATWIPMSNWQEPPYAFGGNSVPPVIMGSPNFEESHDSIDWRDLARLEVGDFVYRLRRNNTGFLCQRTGIEMCGLATLRHGSEEALHKTAVEVVGGLQREGVFPAILSTTQGSLPLLTRLEMS